MNNHHKNGEDKRPLSDGLEEISQAYGRMGHEEPPELLDQAILNTAHRAVEKKPHWTQFGWLHGLTTAAVFVLAFSIILNQREPAPGYENEVMSAKPSLLKAESPEKNKAGFQADESDLEAKKQRQAAPVDTQMPAVMAEEVQLGDTDSMAKSPQAGFISTKVSSAAVAEPTKSDMGLQEQTESEVEQKLAAIIELKQSGDESWKKELELFLQQYPDYPLPDGLKD